MHRALRNPEGCASRRRRIIARVVIVCSAMVVALAPGPGRSQSADTPGTLSIVPADTPSVGNCIPFGTNQGFGFSGFIYRNVPSFTMQPGTRFAFDLADVNDVDVRRNIYFSVASHNPDSAHRNVHALAWTKVVSDTQVPVNARGDHSVGNYELTYTSESDFAFPGGGLIIGFGASPPGDFADGGCDQVGVHTTAQDPSDYFYARFWNKPNLDTSILDRVSWGQTFISGFVVFVDTEPPIVSASISPEPGPDGWVDPGSAAVSVGFSGTDTGSGVASCDPVLTLAEPGVHEVTGTCVDNAGNIGSTTVVVRVARRVTIDVTPGTLNARRQGFGTVAVISGPGFDATSVDTSTVTFGVSGYERSIRGCAVAGTELRCRFALSESGVGSVMVLRAFSDGIRVIGSDTVRVIASPQTSSRRFASAPGSRRRP